MASSDPVGPARSIRARLGNRSGSSRFFAPLTTWARFLIFLVPFALVLAGLLVAGSGVRSATQNAGSTPAVTITPAPDAPRVVITFTELNDSGVSGTATLSEAGEQTIVDLILEDTGDNHPAHIHKGTCDKLEPEPAFALENVRADGNSTSVVDASLQDLIDGGFAIDLHLSPNELGTLVVCANIEGTPEAPTSSGSPQPTSTAAGTPSTPAVTVTATTTSSTPSPAAVPTEIPATPASSDVPATPSPTEPSATETPTPQSVNLGNDATPEVEDGTGGAINDSANAATVPLTSISGLGVTGTAVLTARDDNTTLISVVLSGDAVTTGHIVHLHDGTCDQPGDFTLDLNPVEASGISETEVDRSLTELIADGYFINVHQSEANFDTWFVCGDLSNATVGMVVPEVAPDTGASGTSSTAASGTSPTATSVTSGTSPTAASVGSGTNGTGDGTQGDVAGSGKGIPVGSTTGLPIQAGTGSSLPLPKSTHGATLWLIAIVSLALLIAGSWIRMSDARRATSRSAGR